MATIAAVVAAAATTASAVKSMTDSPGGGGGASAGPGISPNLNQASAYANNLFSSGWNNGGSDSGGLFSQAGKNIYDYLFGAQGTGNDAASQAATLARATPTSFADAQRLFQGTILPGITEVATTGLPTSIDPIIKKQQADFWQQYFPQLKEALPGSTSTYSTDLFKNMNMEQGRIATNLGTLQFNADEAAAARRAAALPVAANLGTTWAGLPSAAARDYMTAINATDPGMRAIDVLGKINEVSKSGQYIQQGNNPAGSNTANMISALGGAAPGLINAGSDLYSKWANPGGSSVASLNAASGSSLNNLFYQPGSLQSSLGYNPASFGPY